ncbi:10690_t:CDS:2, partial [Funneliformis caledonium]
MKALITPKQFTKEDVKNLLDQYSEEECVMFDSASIAENIIEYTFVNNWKKFASVKLQRFIRKRLTYTYIIDFLSELLQSQIDVISTVLQYESATITKDENLKHILAEEMLVVIDDNLALMEEFY